MFSGRKRPLFMAASAGPIRNSPPGSTGWPPPCEPGGSVRATGWLSCAPTSRRCWKPILVCLWPGRCWSPSTPACRPVKFAISWIILRRGCYLWIPSYLTWSHRCVNLWKVWKWWSTLSTGKRVCPVRNCPARIMRIFCNKDNLIRLSPGWKMKMI